MGSRLINKSNKSMADSVKMFCTSPMADLEDEEQEAWDENIAHSRMQALLLISLIVFWFSFLNWNYYTSLFKANATKIKFLSTPVKWSITIISGDEISDEKLVGHKDIFHHTKKNVGCFVAFYYII